MLTDTPPRNRNRAEYLKSDRIKVLNLPSNSLARDCEKTRIRYEGKIDG